MTPITGYRFPFHIVVAVPDARVSTAEAYAGVTPSPEKRAPQEELVRSNDLARWKNELVNDFEASVFGRCPEIAALKRRFYESGAGYASMSGSGSAVFGVFEDAETARRVAENMGAERPVWLEIAQN